MESTHREAILTGPVRPDLSQWFFIFETEKRKGQFKNKPFLRIFEASPKQVLNGFSNSFWGPQASARKGAVQLCTLRLQLLHRRRLQTCGAASQEDRERVFSSPKMVETYSVYINVYVVKRVLGSKVVLPRRSLELLPFVIVPQKKQESPTLVVFAFGRLARCHRRFLVMTLAAAWNPSCALQTVVWTFVAVKPGAEHPISLCVEG